MSRGYEFRTRWRVAAPAAVVWEALAASERWPEWWPSVKSVVAVSGGDSSGVGAVGRFTFRGRLPYSLTFDLTVTRVEPPRLLEGVASGDLEGLGRWTLEESATGTDVCYLWQVRTTKRWMNLLAPLLSPVFAWNHDEVMRTGRQGLERLLRARSSIQG
jgi:uncharacterized protein YndB with AHSA1/START domain